MANPKIVLTNDDGFDSPGLWAIADTLSDFAEVWVTAPSIQFSGAGRCFFRDSDGIIEERESKIPDKGIHAFAINGSPAQTIFHALTEILPCQPDLVVSGINYGENLGNIVSSSGTVGAVIEAASCGIRGLALSLQIPFEEDYLGYSKNIDFSASACFGAKFAKDILSNGLPEKVDFLKVDVPAKADTTTPWKLTSVSHVMYMKKRMERKSFMEKADIIWEPGFDWDKVEKDSDIYAVCKEGLVAVSPMTIDLTAKVAFPEMLTYLD